MKKVLIILGSARKKTTYLSAKEFEKSLEGIALAEYVFLNELNLQFCNGCKLCFDKGEWNCPLKDDRDLLLSKMQNTDGLVIATPNYAFHVSARVKNMLDRIAYYFHRPAFFGKVFMPIVTQGIMGGKKISKYLESSAADFGYTSVKGVCVNTLEPMTDNQIEKLKIQMQKASKGFIKALKTNNKKSPSLYRLMMFRMTRTGIKNARVKLYDYEYFDKQGWFQMPYYYQVKLSFIKRIFGRFFDFIGKKIGAAS